MERQARERALEYAESEFHAISQKIRDLNEASNAEFKLAKTGRKEFEHLYKSSGITLREACRLCSALYPLEAEIWRHKAALAALDPGERG